MVHVLLVVLQAPVPVHSLQPVHSLHVKDPVGAGHDAERVFVRCSGRCWVMAPDWPDGHANVCSAVRVSVLVCVLGVGNTQMAAQSPLSTNTPGVPSQAHGVATGKPVGLGQDQVRCSPVVQLLPVPDQPAGQAPLYGAGRHSGAGATQAVAHVLTKLRVAPVLDQLDQLP